MDLTKMIGHTELLSVTCLQPWVVITLKRQIISEEGVLFLELTWALSGDISCDSLADNAQGVFLYMNFTGTLGRVVLQGSELLITPSPLHFRPATLSYLGRSNQRAIVHAHTKNWHRYLTPFTWKSKPGHSICHGVEFGKIKLSGSQLSPKEINCNWLMLGCQKSQKCQTVYIFCNVLNSKLEEILNSIRTDRV